MDGSDGDRLRHEDRKSKEKDTPDDIGERGRKDKGGKSLLQERL